MGVPLTIAFRRLADRCFRQISRWCCAEKRIAELEAALFQIIAQGGKAEVIARKALGLTDCQR